MTISDRWVLLRVGGTHKIFATWAGGYLDGDSWRMNSGIAQVSEADDHYIVTGYSGSVYHCRKGSYGVAGGYNYQALEDFLDIDSVSMVEEADVATVMAQLHEGG